MADFISNIKAVPYGEACVFNLLSDLSNLRKVSDRIPQDKLQDFRFDADSCSFKVSPVGNITFRIVEREPYKTVKLQTTDSPVPLTLWVQLKQIAEADTRMRLTVRADLSPFLKPMVSRPLQEALERIADLLANLPYDTLNNEQ